MPEEDGAKAPQRLTDWEAIRRAYEADATTLKALGARFTVSPQSISRRAKRDGWRCEHRPARRGGRKPSPGKDAIDMIEAIVAEEAALARKALQRSRKDDLPVSDADRERRARTLNTLLRTYDKIREMKHEILENARRTAGDADQAPSERLSPDDIRREIKRRLDRILAAADAGEVAEGSQPDGA